MNQQTESERLGTHVRMLGWLLIVTEILGLCVGGLVFMFLSGIGAASGEPEAMRILPLVGLFALGIFTIFSLPGFLAGFGLLRRCAWARYLGLVVALINLTWVPIGTAVGVYAFWVLLQKGTAEYLERCDPFDDDYDAYEDEGGGDDDAVEEVYFHGDDEGDAE